MAWTPASSSARRFHSPESSPNHSNIHSWVPSGLVAKPSRDKTILRTTFLSLMSVRLTPTPELIVHRGIGLRLGARFGIEPEHQTAAVDRQDRPGDEARLVRQQVGDHG